MNCINCKRDNPEPFKVSDGRGGEIDCYWHVLPKGSDDPTVLMSSGELIFRMSDEKNPEPSDKFDFLCGSCACAMMGHNCNE